MSRRRSPAQPELPIEPEPTSVESELLLTVSEPSPEVRELEPAPKLESVIAEAQEIFAVTEVKVETPVHEAKDIMTVTLSSETPEVIESIEPIVVEAALPAVEEIVSPSTEAIVIVEKESRALVASDPELGLAVRESACSEIKVEENTAVVPVESVPVPALWEENRHMAIAEERALPALKEKETAITVQPLEAPPSPMKIERDDLTVPSAEISAVEPASMAVPSAPMSEAMLNVPEPVIETPAEPEIPISDRELKAALLLNVMAENARALEEINHYIREKSESHDARHIKAIILDDMGRLPECLEELKEAIRMDPKDEIALLDIESISRRLGRKEESMIILSSITPSREVRGREAVNMLEAKRYDEILSKFSSPGPTDSLVTRMAVATSLMAKARYRDAYRVLKEILLEHPTYPEALNNMGVCMRFMGEYAYDQPMHFMRLAVEADPNYGDAWNNIGATLFVIGEYDAAMEAIRNAISVDRRSDYLINMSKCQIMVGDIAGAKLSLTSALKYEETAEIDFALGLIAEKEGEMKWALKLYDSAIELVPNFKDAIFNRQRVKLFLKYTQK